MTRYWGAIAFHRVGAKTDLWFWLGLLGCVFLVFGFSVWLVAATTEDEPPPAPVIERHGPSDLDKGGNPSSFEKGQPGPDGLPGKTG